MIRVHLSGESVFGPAPTDYLNSRRTFVAWKIKQFFDPKDNQAKIDVLYQGEVDEQKKRDGRGISIDPSLNGPKLVIGRFRQDKYHGHCFFISADGSKSAGFYLDGVLTEETNLPVELWN